MPIARPSPPPDSAAKPRGLTLSQLAARSRTPIPSIKFYLREGLLPRGTLLASRRALYDERHLLRLRVIHALRQVGRLSVGAAREVCALLDGAGSTASIDALVARSLDALARGGGGGGGGGRPHSDAKARVRTETAAARRDLLAFLRTTRVRVRPESAVLDDLARALVALRQVIGPEVGAEAIAPYLEAMLALAERDYAANQHLFSHPATAADAAALALTLGTVLWEPVLVLVRRLALEHLATHRPAAARAPRRPTTSRRNRR